MSKIKRYLEDLEAEIEEVFNDVDFDDDVMETMVMNLDRQKRKYDKGQSKRQSLIDLGLIKD